MPNDPKAKNNVPNGEITSQNNNEIHEDSTFKDCAEDLYMINIEENIQQPSLMMKLLEETNFL